MCIFFRTTRVSLLLLLTGSLIVGCNRTEPLFSNNTTTQNSEQVDSSKTITAQKAELPAVQPIDIDDPVAIDLRIKNDITYLAADERQGRGTFTDGLDQAADYLAAEFKKLGLRTDFYDDSPFQVFNSKTNWGYGSVNHIDIEDSKNKTTRLVLGKDYTPLNIGRSAKLNFPLAFAGYGISSEEDQYDDYQSVNVKGKAVILLRHEPIQSTNTSRFNGNKNSAHAYLSSKVINAAKHGATAVIFCTDQVALENRAAKSRNRTVDHDYLLKISSQAELKDPLIPVLHCRREIIEKLLASEGKPSLAIVEQQIDETLEPHSFELPNARISGEIQIERRTQSLKNVIAMLPGTGPNAEETIVIGAHYDHLGMGGSGSLAPWTVAIHNGADDNASGTTALLEIARQLSHQLKGDHRRILFIGFSAEEKGLIGSNFYVKQPLVPLKKTVAMFNLDMVGRLRNDKLTLYGTGTAKEFPELATTAADEQGIKLSMIPSGYGPSDHASFYGKGVPVFHFFTGFHSDYHRPSDDSEKINIAGVRRIAKMASSLVAEVATAEQKPTASSSGSVLDFYLPATSARRSTNIRPTGPQLGITISELAEKQGIRIDKVSPNTTAERGQLKAGDIILKVNGTPITKGQQLRDEIKKIKKGDTLPFIIRRGSIEFLIDVKF